MILLCSFNTINTNILCVNFLIIDLYTYNIFYVVICIKNDFEYYSQRTSLNTCPWASYSMVLVLCSRICMLRKFASMFTLADPAWWPLRVLLKIEKNNRWFIALVNSH
jgi:hypothetical protein